MQRAGHQRPLRSGAISAPPAEITIRLLDESALRGEVSPAPVGSKQASARGVSQEALENAIRRRIEARLCGRVRNLNVRVLADLVILEGQCATYYTKQIAQHAAMGILEDEQLENAIIVRVEQ
jgi:osmotically-inducible protein OsmY